MFSAWKLYRRSLRNENRIARPLIQIWGVVGGFKLLPVMNFRDRCIFILIFSRSWGLNQTFIAQRWIEVQFSDMTNNQEP